MVSPWINYHHLFYFKTITEEGSISRAAQKLRLSQPTLSTQLKQLESSLGVVLFERQGRTLTLTEAGKVAFEYARTIFKTGLEMFEAIHDRHRPDKHSLHIGAIDSIAKQVVLKLVQSAFNISRCQITLSEGKPDELIRELLAHRVDLVVTNLLPSGSDAKGLIPRSISKKNVSIYGTSKFRSLKKGFPKSISAQPIIVPSYHSRLRQDVEHWANLNGIELNIIAESQDIALKKLMATESLGIIPLAAHAARRQTARGELLEIGQLRGVYEEIFLVKTSRKISNPVASKLFQGFQL